MANLSLKNGIHEYKPLINNIGIHIKYQYNKNANTILFFLHGLGCSLDNFNSVFQNNYFPGTSLFLFDLPGFGDSDKPDDFPYTLEAHAGIMEKLLRPFTHLRIYIIAHSMGGAVALNLPDNIFNKISGFICLEGNLIGDDCFVSRQVSSFSREEFEKTQFHRYKRKFVFSKIMDLKRTTSFAFYASSQSLVQWSDSGRLLKRFKDLACKKAYFYGEKNRNMVVLNQLAGIQTYMIGGCGHCMMIEQPELLYSAIRTFI